MYNTGLSSVPQLGACLAHKLKPKIILARMNICTNYDSAIISNVFTPPQQSRAFETCRTLQGTPLLTATMSMPALHHATS